jgi:uncharacterized repeat protein (TIGR03806 family)
VHLTWAASTDSGTGVAGYRLFRDGNTTPIATVSGTSYSDTGLTGSTTYSYTVRAYDNASPANESAASAATGITTLVSPDITPPTVPTGLSGSAVSDTEVQLTWTASTDSGTGVAGYRIFRGSSTTPVATVTGTTYVDSGLAASTSYSYTLRAFDNASPTNVSGASAAASVSTLAPVSGLDVRPSNTSCLAGDAPDTDVSFALQQVYPALSFQAPVAMVHEPGNESRWYVVEQTGHVRVFDNQVNVSTSRVLIDLSALVDFDANERGLIGMAFHPDYATNHKVYLSYTHTDGSDINCDPTSEVGCDHTFNVVEYRSTDGGLTLNSATATQILTIHKPGIWHHGGNLVFGADGYLYLGTGDGGGIGDPHPPIGNGQRLSTIMGKLLRIDVTNNPVGTPYAIPAGNLNATNAICNDDRGAYPQDCPEIYAYGLRNPWRWSFDRDTQELWLGDVGQDEREEIDHVVQNGNYGWRCFEGSQPFDSICGPNAATAIAPIAEFDHGTGNAIVGGYVYRGTQIPALRGRFVFGDYVPGYIWSIATDTTPTLTLTAQDGLNAGFSISSFAEGVDGELYALDIGGGRVMKIVAAGSPTGHVIPDLLSATGCVSSTDPKLPASGLIPYAPIAPFWSDNALKSRFLAVPDGQQISINSTNDFDFPVGSVLVKNFQLNGKLIETRLFMHHNDGTWAGYTYEWNAQQTDATRVIGGKNVTIGSQQWHYPSESQCLRCHTAAAGRTLGLEVSQQNSLIAYPATGRTANQLTTLDHIGMLSPALSQPVEDLPTMPNPYGTAGTLEQRARAYLHTNCSQCHRPGGGTPATMDLRYTTPLASTNACEVAPQDSLGISNARLIAVGAAARSLIAVRPSRTDSTSMPPFQPRVVDAPGVALLTSWINGLASCN